MSSVKLFKLTVELVPKQLWYENVRSTVQDEVWNQIKLLSRQYSDYKCAICSESGNDQVFKWPTETHEVWKYKDKKHIQVLIGIQALCPLCHKAKHWGRTMSVETSDMQDEVMDHFQKVNDCSLQKMNLYINSAFAQWHNRNRYKWTADLEYIYEYISAKLPEKEK